MPPSTLSDSSVDARVLVHRLDDLAALVGGRLQRRAGDVARVDVAGQAREHAARVGLPVRREQARERRHDVAAAVVLDASAASSSTSGAALIIFRLSRSHCTSAPVIAIDALEAVDRVLVADLVADRGQQAVLRRHRLGARVEQQEVARAVRVLRLAGREARLAERRRLLVAQVAGDRHARRARRPTSPRRRPRWTP